MIFFLLGATLTLITWQFIKRQPLRSDDDIDAGQW